MSHAFVRAARGATLVLLLFTQAVAAQSVEPETLIQEMTSLRQQGKYDQAVVVGKKVLEIAEREYNSDNPNVATVLNNLAGLYESQGQYAAAEPLYKRSLVSVIS